MIDSIDEEIHTVANQIFDNAEKWIDNNIDYFDLTVTRKNADDELKFKSFIELLFMFDIFYPKNLFTPDINKKIVKLEEKVVKNVSFSSYFLNDPILVSGIQETITFNKNNQMISQYNNEKQHFESMINGGLDILAPRTPYRLLDSRYSMEKAGLDNNLKSKEFYYNLTVLNDENFNYLYLSDNSAYSITHTLFYITDMGREQPPYLDVTRINNILYTMLIFYLCKKNMDILGETLLSLFFVNLNLSKMNKKLVLSSLKIIEKNQNEKGYIYSPRHLNDDTLSQEQQFFENYHTTMVGLGAAYVFK
ncbi:hypothetical protein QP385_05465 [Lactobacillus iners]|uniref:DUF6895 family protein n=1 Tax=Lactobacillus iners TaxID=147802 RepID=UPI00254ECC76|nr:hypothetical protein [Lactobacillus iners]MDK7109008.1 hypothetical protein [Lactobacillus iners]